MSAPAAAGSVRYCGRIFTIEEIDRIRELLVSEPRRNRLQLSRVVCDELGWLRADGRRKDMSCRVAMLRMHRDGLITLPPPQKGNGNGRTRPRLTSASDPREPITLPAGALGELLFRPVNTRKDSSLWNELIERYHYLGYKPLPGAQIRYLVFSGPHLLAALGFGAAAWALAPRDRFIGWTAEQRVHNLHLVVNNARFLILPWVSSQNLASRVLAGVARRLPKDWQTRYGYQPVLLETFVEQGRFHGTCYRAGNWIQVGQTQGRGKLDRHTRYPLPVKDIFLYPLHKRFRRELRTS
ncbi:hypothetical protein HKBW3S03_00640 [Candidatus Hakubella thermalkaliphila]|uniref:Uncharacterized protein n=4 Tax=Candidatus Hakubella thermalkaliphila TaxID=2754717 RepID=A0A6V8NKT0_9ACTN|nr:hypothetical protein HKBW3S03_00640 [Candidatus Hakubella thermalkaliphila]